MENTYRPIFLLFFLFLSQLFMVSGRSFPLVDTHPRESRKLLLVSNFISLSANPVKVNESMIAPEKAVKNSLRSKPPSSWNPIHNNLHP
ncbi:hypothetical protein RND71_040556 [Anisodus tanguticus]|uniref:Agouti signaling protein n=1 Tax=Anisodus tanguticus TaxID=243964 RepID=A0AAE1QTR3_9SOLA|nr:hypothetical protein RND71_040556 [Anisodus tanguticus]